MARAGDRVLRRLRRKFVLVNMLLVLLVLLAVFAALVGSNAQRLRAQTQSALRLALEWADGEPPRFAFGDLPPGQEEGQGFTMIPAFCVTLDETGAVAAVSSGGNVSVTDEMVAQAVEQALAAGEEQGELSRLALCYRVEAGRDAETRIAFADRSWEGRNLADLVRTSLLVGAGALAVFFLISLFLSSLSLRPVERAWAQQRQFVADASHELKTPITVILANTGIVLSHPEDTVAHQRKWITYIQEEAARMRGLVEDLLFLAKSDAARLPLHPMTFSMSDLVTSCLLPFESVAFEAGVALDSAITPHLTLTGDEGQLRRLVMILLDNAVKYAGAEGAVTVTLDRLQDKVRLSVHNTGSPIPPQHLPHLFERFYRVDGARNRSEGGYGLGLAIAKSITLAHHGKIWAESAPGAGTTFTALLPAGRGRLRPV